jgi:type II secretory pathway pseudopilin PulG
MKILKRKKGQGFTLIELLLVVGFIALASIGIYLIYHKVSQGNQANTEARNLDTIRAGIKNLYGATSNFATLTNNVVNNAHITPDNMLTTGNAGSITNSFGGAVNITPASLGSGTNNGFEIDYPNVPDAICVKLVSTDGANFDKVVVAGTTVKAFGTNTMDPGTVASACNQGNPNGEDIQFFSI